MNDKSKYFQRWELVKANLEEAKKDPTTFAVNLQQQGLFCKTSCKWDVAISVKHMIRRISRGQGPFFKP